MRAAQLAYYFFLSIFPLAIFLLALVGIFAADSEHFRAELFSLASQIAPSSPLLRKTIEQIASKSGDSVLSIGIIVALWSASSGMSAVMDALNHHYRVSETRPFIKRTAIALGLTVAAGILLLLAIMTALVGTKIIAALGAGSIVRWLWQIGRWVIVLLLALIGFDLIYCFGPRVHREWRWFSPGAVTALLLWIAASVGFRVYVAYFGHYNATYGSLGAVVILLLWFYITGLAILIGSEVNIVAENASAEPAKLDHAA